MPRWDAEVAAAVAYWQPRRGVSIDPALVHAIIEKETRHGALPLTVLEPDGDRSFGPMSVKGATARTVLGIHDPATLIDPGRGIMAGVDYLARKLKQYPGQVDSAIAAYNAGTARRRSSGAFINQPYVVDVLGFWNAFKRTARAAAPALLSAFLIAAAVWWLARRRRVAFSR